MMNIEDMNNSAHATELPSDQNSDLMAAMYRRPPEYTKTVFAMVELKVNSEQQIREFWEKLLLLAV
ncbi:MAG: hypothetical protein JW908_12390 [Anaerolineales bacterium]|nr:hypothetical protein [Anaerolineales bacterium]